MDSKRAYHISDASIPQRSDQRDDGKSDDDPYLPHSRPLLESHHIVQAVKDTNRSMPIMIVSPNLYKDDTVSAEPHEKNPYGD